jgi:hypothetical protein
MSQIQGPPCAGGLRPIGAVIRSMTAPSAPPRSGPPPSSPSTSTPSSASAGDEGRLAPEVVQVRETPVLILDDLGAQKWTGFAEEQLFLVLDYRSRERLPTMGITNEALESLPGRIASRLAGREFSRVVLNPAPDYRWGDGRVTV